MSGPSVQDIVAAVDKLENESVAMLHEIVSHPSLLNDEKSVQDFMFKKFEELHDAALQIKQVPVHRSSFFTLPDPRIEFSCILCFPLSNFTSEFYNWALQSARGRKLTSMREFSVSQIRRSKNSVDTAQ
jgi:hypothetical protein